MSAKRDQELDARLAQLRQKAAVPVFWLFGKTQSGKTSIVRFLTGAEDAEIGQGFRPCTRFSRAYDFPTEEAPLLTFLDTRGLDEPGYDPAEDIANFHEKAHVVIVTSRLLDLALENVVRALEKIRRDRPGRPVVLALTCLHEAYPQQQHPAHYPFTGKGVLEKDVDPATIPETLQQALAEQRRRFASLCDHVVPLDITPREEGFSDPNYGGDRFKEVLLHTLPEAYRQTLIHLDQATGELQDLYARHALPCILGYATLAATAAAFPIPWVDLFVLPGIQSRMVFHLGQLYGQPVNAQRFAELASSLGLGILIRQAAREVFKFIPFVGSVASAALAGAATYALGKALCYYFSAVHKGHVPRAEDLRRYYDEQLSLAEKLWRGKGPSA